MAKKGYVGEKELVSGKVSKKPVITKVDSDVIDRLKLQDLKSEAESYFNSAADSRKRYDWEWLTRDLYRRGYQFSNYDKSSRTVVLSTRGQVKIPINLAWSQMRVIRNQVTSFRPKWEILPRGKSEEMLNNARYSGKLLDYFFDKFKLKKKLKDTIVQALTYSVGGPWQIGYDPDGDEGEGEVFIWDIDTYDFYVDPKATTLDDAEFCGKAVRKPLEEIKTDTKYTFKEPLEHGEHKVAESEYKQFLIQAIRQQGHYEEAAEEGAILKEMYVKVRVSEDKKEELAKELKKNDQDADKLRQGEVLTRVVTYLDFLADPLRVQLLRRSDFPFVLYDGDSNPQEIYGPSWMRHIIPMNRVLNALESSVFEYNYRYAKGRLVIDKNSGVRLVNNQHGGIIEKNKGAEVTSLPLQPLPVSYQNQIENMRRYIEDIGGAHDISLGRIPTGVKSGVGIAELKSADATNQQDYVDNLEIFLVEVAQKILREVADNYDAPKLVKALGKGGDPDHFAVIGEKNSENRRRKTEVKIGMDVFDLAVIGQNNEIRVTVGSWLAHTKSAQQEKLKELFEAGLIDQKTFLEHTEFADVQNIVERTRQEELLNKFRGTPAEQGMPSDEEIAEQENYQMIQEGKLPDAEATDNHNVHLAVHQEALGSQGNPIVESHMSQHETFLREGTAQQAQNLAGSVLPQPQQEQIPSGATGSIPAEAPQGQPQSPEEMALLQSMQGIQ